MHAMSPPWRGSNLAVEIVPQPVRTAKPLRSAFLRLSLLGYWLLDGRRAAAPLAPRTRIL